MINLSLLISKYSIWIVLFGVIVWFTVMALKRPADKNTNPENLSKLGLAIEKAKPIFENFQRNVAETYGPKEEAPKKKSTKKEEVQPKKVSGISDIKQEDIIKPLDF